MTLLAVAYAYGREALHVISKVQRVDVSTYRGRPQVHWVRRFISSLRIFGMDNQGAPVDVMLVKKKYGPEGKGRAASALGLSHFVDNDMDCLWSLCRDSHGNVRDRMEANGGRLVWFGCDGPAVSQDEVNQRLDREIGRFIGRDRGALKKWVEAAASWACVAELIDSRVADAVQVGWE